MTNKVTGDQVIKKAKSYKGKYKKQGNKFEKYFAGKYGISKKGVMPKKMGYCTLFCGYVFAKLGIFDLIPHKKVKQWWHTQKLLKWYKKHHPEWVVTDPAKAKKGALAFKKCGSTKKKTSGHTALFDKYDKKTGMVYTVDGNCGGGVITRKKKKAWYIAFVNVPLAKSTKQ